MNKGDFIYSYENTKIKQHEIVSVGRIWLETNTRHKVRIENLRTENKNYSQYDIQFFKSEQEIKDMLDAGATKSKVLKCFPDYSNKITEKQYKDIAKILGV